MAAEATTQGATTEGAIRAEQVRTLYRQSPWIYALNPLNAAVVGAVLWAPARGRLIVAWVFATALVAAARGVLRDRFLAADARPADPWAWRYVAGAAASGVLWGAGSVLLYTSGDHAVELILIFVLGGMSAGAAGTLAYHLPAFFAFAAPTILPISVRMLLEGGALHAAMGALGLVYGAALAVIARNTNRAVGRSFRLGFDNEALLGRLTRAQAELEDANRTLERRVQERSAALKKQDEALQEARRMESLGLLAGGVAHDFNNLLTVILGNAALLDEDPGLARAPDGPLREIREASERASSLVSQLLASSRRQARSPRVLDLNAVVSDAQRLLARLIGEHIELAVELGPRPLPVVADPAQLEQVIVNLATNARDAMSAGGKLTIETDVADVGADGGGLTPPLEPGPYVVLSVRDTGVGMDSETRRKAFHPFFTTKEVGRGTGLGLATVNGIVEQSGGRVFLDSQPGRGSCFRVFLPQAQVAAAREAVPTPLASPERAATVLLVEDEPKVRSVVARALAGAGLTVLEADNGQDALARAHGHAGPIDVVVTDVVMARMGGPELARRLAADRPDIRVLFISGYDRDSQFPPAGAPEGADYLEKPFTSGALVDRVARLLRAPPAPTPGRARGDRAARARR
jgi:signal transduction histidine kinase/CheY-like chemotaxis protein